MTGLWYAVHVDGAAGTSACSRNLFEAIELAGELLHAGASCVRVLACPSRSVAESVGAPSCPAVVTLIAPLDLREWKGAADG